MTEGSRPTLLGFLRRIRSALVLLLPSCTQPPPDMGGLEGPHRIEVTKTVRVQTSDGAELAGTLFRPSGVEGPLPSVLIRLPYNREWYTPATDPARYFASWGYAVLVQDVRGRWGSTGSYRILADDRRDGRETLDWIARQPWSNGLVGTFGCSNLGENQLVLAAEGHPAHAAMIPQGAAGAVGTMGGWNSAFSTMEGGALGLSTLTGWFLDWGGDGRPAVSHEMDRDALVRTLPVADFMSLAGVDDAEWRRYVTELPGARYWDEQGYLSDADELEVPGLFVDTWYDPGVSRTLDLVARAEPGAAAGPAGVPRHAVIGPWDHCRIESAPAEGTLGDLEISGAAYPYWETYRRWFDHWLRVPAAPLDPMPRYTFFTYGENRWRTSEAWPPEWTERQEWFVDLSSATGGAVAGGVSPDGPPDVEASVSYDYDPAGPIPSKGGTACCTGFEEDEAGPFDVGYLDGRTDIVRVASPPLGRDLLIVGPVSAVLEVSSSALDTDFVVKLVHVDPAGHALAIREGVQRMRYREGGASEVWMSPEETYEIRILLGDIAYRIPEGHHLRLDISSSNFPRWDRNLNTDAPRGLGTTWVVARNTLHSGGAITPRLVFHSASPTALTDGR